jgi:hypothetical protein
VAAEHARLLQRRQKKRGRAKKTVVTEPALSLSRGYLIGNLLYFTFYLLYLCY